MEYYDFGHVESQARLKEDSVETKSLGRTYPNLGRDLGRDSKKIFRDWESQTLGRYYLVAVKIVHDYMYSAWLIVQLYFDKYSET